jgi:hypothetical protein
MNSPFDAPKPGKMHTLATSPLIPNQSIDLKQSGNGLKAPFPEVLREQEITNDSYFSTRTASS